MKRRWRDITHTYILLIRWSPSRRCRSLCSISTVKLCILTSFHKMSPHLRKFFPYYFGSKRSYPLPISSKGQDSHWWTFKDVTYKKFTYHPWAHNKFSKIFKHHNIVLMPQNKYSIKNLLNSNLKDDIPPEKKSGIYQINCKDCERDVSERQKRFGN